jgi:hypothetical protein
MLVVKHREVAASALTNHVSIWFSHDAEVGLKWKAIRG